MAFLIFLFTKNINSGYLGLGNFRIAELPVSWYSNYFTTFLGLPFRGFYSTDYFSLLPWFFLFLFGCFIGKWFKERKIPDFMMNKHSDFLCRIGSSTLAIYIVHQPIIYGVLSAFFWVIEKGTSL